MGNLIEQNGNIDDSSSWPIPCGETIYIVKGKFAFTKTTVEACYGSEFVAFIDRRGRERVVSKFHIIWDEDKKTMK